MLRLILDRGDVAIPSESMYVIDADVRKPAEDVLADVWAHPRVALWGLEGAPPPIPAGLERADAYRFAFTAPYAAYAEREGKTRWGDKTPAYLGYVDRLATIWPDARFVVLVRDGRDVALSVMKVPFGPNNVWAAARSWAHAIRLGQDAAERYPGRVLTVRYEDLVERPEEEVRRVCDFLELTYTPELLAIEETDPSKMVEDQAAWFTSVWAGINTDAVGKWRREMSAEDEALFESVAGSELAAFGATRRAVTARAPAYAHRPTPRTTPRCGR